MVTDGLAGSSETRNQNGIEATIVSMCENSCNFIESISSATARLVLTVLSVHYRNAISLYHT
jgi:hypothetical protein